jgi:hypothetical protein
MTHPGARHYDLHRYGSNGYCGGEEDAYGAPPMVYVPAPVPSLSLCVPLRLR